MRMSDKEREDAKKALKEAGEVSMDTALTSLPLEKDEELNKTTAEMQEDLTRIIKEAGMEDQIQVSVGEGMSDADMQQLMTLMNEFPKDPELYKYQTVDLDYIGHTLWLHYDRACELNYYKDVKPEDCTPGDFYESLPYQRSFWESIALDVLEGFGAFPMNVARNNEIPKLCPVINIALLVENKHELYKNGNYYTPENIFEDENRKAVYMYMVESMASEHLVFLPKYLLGKLYEICQKGLEKSTGSATIGESESCCCSDKCCKAKQDEATE